jgi:ribosomal protein L37AE/L43A
MNDNELPKDAYANQCPKCKAEVFTVFIQGDIYWKCEKCGTLTIQKTLPHFPYNRLSIPDAETTKSDGQDDDIKD